MEIYELCIVLPNVILHNGCIYSEEEEACQELRDKYKCRNFYKVKNKSELPPNQTLKEINECVFHDIGHAATNIGHYFNDHFYSLVTCIKNYNVPCLANYPVHDTDFLHSTDERKGNVNWGVSLFHCMDFNTITYNSNTSYYINKIYLPRENRGLAFIEQNSIDPLLYIRNKIIQYVKPKTTEQITLFFNKKTDRNVINADEVITFLQKTKKNVKVIDSFQNLSFAEIVELLYNTECFIAPWGSHLTNVLFMKPNTNVYEIHPQNMRDGWWNMMGNNFKKRCNINYINVPCEYVESSTKKREETKTSINTQNLWNYSE